MSDLWLEITRNSESVLAARAAAVHGAVSGESEYERKRRTRPLNAKQTRLKIE